MASVSKDGSKFIFAGSFDERHLPKAAGWRWNPDTKKWWTDSVEKAGRLAKYADASCQADLGAASEQRTVALEASRATDATVEIPVPAGLSYLPYQKAGIAYALSRPATLIGDEMGLGKTIQALGVINADISIQKVLIVCPASLRINWTREANKWLVQKFTSYVVKGKKPEMWPRELMPRSLVVVNYDILADHSDALRAQVWDLVIIDEGHKLKNAKAKRTVALLGKTSKKAEECVAPVEATRRLLLTGTPIVNRPVELFPLLNYLDPANFSNFFGYAKRYCNAHQGRYGWDFSGSAHLDELQDKLRTTIMVRRLKADVLKELPAKTRQVVVINTNGATAAVQAEKLAWDSHASTLSGLRAKMELAKASEDGQDYEDAQEAYKTATKFAFAEMARIRHETAVAKIPHVVDHVSDLLEDGDNKVIVMTHHHEVVDGIAEGLKEFGATKLTGRDSMEVRDAAVQAFQNDPSCRVFVGSIQAAGVGLTLTASAHVVFAELDFVPGNVTQAEDRAHRIGQKNAVLVQHLVFEGSIDERFVEILLEKQRIIDSALDDKHVDAVALAEGKVAEDTEKNAAKREAEKAALLKFAMVPSVVEGVSTDSLTPAEVEEKALVIGQEKINAVHQGLKMLAGFCDGAHELDGAGFSKVDVAIGHSLAARGTLTARQAILGLRLCNKYRRQLPNAIKTQLEIAL